jgi:hypothetical protein
MALHGAPLFGWLLRLGRPSVNVAQLIPNAVVHSAKYPNHSSTLNAIATHKSYYTRAKDWNLRKWRGVPVVRKAVPRGRRLLDEVIYPQ